MDTAGREKVHLSIISCYIDFPIHGLSRFVMITDRSKHFPLLQLIRAFIYRLDDHLAGTIR